MKITFLLPGDSCSGGIRVTMEMGNCLLARGYNVRIAYRTPTMWSSERIRAFARSVKFAMQGLSETRWLRNFRGTRAPFRRLEDLDFERGEVVIATGELTVGELQSVDRDVVKLRYCHGFVDREVERMCAAWGGPMGTIAVSQGLVPTLERLSKRRVLGIVPNGIWEEEYFVEPQVRDGIGLVFSQHPLKGPEVAISLIERFAHALPGVPIYSFGASRRLSAFCPSEYTRFPSVSKAREIYNRCKVWLVTSRDEGFCLPLLEAMACGCVVITSRHTNAEEVIAEGINGFTVSYGDLDGYVQAVRAVFGDEGLRNEIVEQGFQTVKRFSWESATNRMEDVLNKSVAQGVLA